MSVAPPTAVAPPVPVPAVPSDVTIEVRSTPAGAAVWAGDKQMGTTPLRLMRPRATEALALRVALSGYEVESIDVGLDHDRLVELHLRPGAPPVAVPSPPTTPSAHASPPGTHASTHAKPAHSPSVKSTGRDGQLKDPFAQ